MDPEHESLIPRPRNAFWKIQCSACNNEQVVFSAASTRVECVACNQELGQPTGHLLRLTKAKLVEEFHPSGAPKKQRKKKAAEKEKAEGTGEEPESDETQGEAPSEEMEGAGWKSGKAEEEPGESGKEGVKGS